MNLPNRQIHVNIKSMSKQKGRDFASNALRVVEQAIGEHMDGTPLEEAESQKTGRAESGKKGGQSRAKALTVSQRRQIAMKAARARWKTQKGDSTENL